MAKVKFEKVSIDIDEAVVKMIEMFDTSGNRQINEEEFVAGLDRWLDTSRTDEENRAPKSHETQDDFYQVRRLTFCRVFPVK